MKDKRLIYGLIILLIGILVGYAIYKSYQFENSPMKAFSFSEYPNEITNFSSTPYLDTVTHVMLRDMGVFGVRIALHDVTNTVSTNIMAGSVVNGFVAERFDGVIQVFILPDKSKIQTFQILSHELIHVKQLVDGRLNVLDGNTAIWNGDTVDIHKWEYKNRPWEVEAYNNQNSIRWNAINFLYE
jgi:hypothetical protein